METSVPRLNNFTPLRFVLASMVAVCHLAELSQIKEFQFFNKYMNAPLAVNAFFVISGFLIYKSYSDNSDLKKYFKKRLYRILPGYFCVVLVCAIAFVSISSLNYQNYFLNYKFWKYLISNLVTLNFIEPELPGVFQHNYISAINGSLWTIKFEIAFYIYLPFIIFIQHFTKPKLKPYILPAFLLVTLLISQYILFLYNSDPIKYSKLHLILRGKFCYFLTGMIYYKYFSSFIKHKHMIGLAGFLLSVVALKLKLEWLLVLSLAGVIMWLAFVPTALFPKLNDHDYSYGIYLWHFPIVQLLTHFHWFDAYPWAALVGSLTIIGITAASSWYLVERKYIRNNRRLILATS